jgi:hypothetical protein
MRLARGRQHRPGPKAPAGDSSVSLWIGCETQPLRVPAEMVLDKRGNEEIRVIVAFVNAQR